jgi:WD40 repeat protein
LVGGLLGTAARPAVMSAFWLVGEGPVNGGVLFASVVISCAIGLCVGALAGLIGAAISNPVAGPLVGAIAGAFLAFALSVVTFLFLCLGTWDGRPQDIDVNLYFPMMALSGAAPGALGGLVGVWVRSGPLRRRTTSVVIVLLVVAVIVGAWVAFGQIIGLTGDHTKPGRDHTDTVLRVGFSPDGTRIVSGASDRFVKVWDVDGGRQTVKLPRVPFQVKGVVFCGDGKRIVAAGGRDDDGGSGRWWGMWMAFDAGTGKKVFAEDQLPEIHAVACSPDGAHFATGHADGTIVVWDAVNGKRVREIKAHREGWVAQLAYSPDGKRIASASSDKTIKVSEAESGAEVFTLEGHKDYVHCLAYSPDGKRLASGGREKAIILWDAFSGKAIRALQGHKGVIHALTFSPDGKRLASVSEVQTGPNRPTVPGEIKLWDAEGGREVLSLTGHEGAVHAVAFSPDGKHLVTGGGGRGPERSLLGSMSQWPEIKAWDAESGAAVLSLGLLSSRRR